MLQTSYEFVAAGSCADSQNRSYNVISSTEYCTTDACDSWCRQKWVFFLWMNNNTKHHDQFFGGFNTSCSQTTTSARYLVLLGSKDPFPSWYVNVSSVAACHIQFLSTTRPTMILIILWIILVTGLSQKLLALKIEIATDMTWVKPEQI